MSALLIISLVFLLVSVLTALLACTQGGLRILDHPGERSLHEVPVPRTGGLAILAGGIAGAGGLLFVQADAFVSVWMAGALLAVGAVSLLDDLSDLRALPRLIVHAMAAGMLVLGGLTVESLHLPGNELVLGIGSGAAVTILFIVWLTNLYNFMDGMDGLAGGMAVFGFGTLGVLGWMAGDEGYAALCWVIAAAAGGFLVWNLPPARIFMGDTGSSVLGLLVAALSLYGDAAGLFPLWIAGLVFSPFIADATVTLLRRTLQGERVWEPHRNHYYQRLVQLGWGHRRTLWWEYGLMAVCCGAALIASGAPADRQWLIIAAVVAIYVLAICGVRRLELRAEASAPLSPTDRGGG